MGRRRGASETRAHDDSAEVRPPGARSLGGEGTYATVEMDMIASGGLGFFVWSDGGVGQGAADDTRAHNGGAEVRPPGV